MLCEPPGSRAALCRKHNFLSLPGQLQNQVAVVLRQLPIGVEEFNAVNGPVRRDIDVDLVADLEGRHLAGFFVKPDIRDVVLWIVGDSYCDDSWVRSI